MNSHNLLISIIIPCYNHGQFIDDALKSIEQYKGNDYEIIIINDGSTDDFTNNRLKELKEEGYNVISQVNQGLGKSRNNGIKLARGKYILPLDADNLIKPEYIIKSVGVLENNPDISIVYSDRFHIGIENGIVKVGDLDVKTILRENYIDACAVFRKSVWTEIGGYDENMPFQGLEDWDFWISAIEKGFKFFYIPEPLFLYRVQENSMIRRLSQNSEFKRLLDYIYCKHTILMIDHIKYALHELRNENTSLRLALNSIRLSKSYRLGRFFSEPYTSIKRYLNAHFFRYSSQL